jgi:hypothetical protein
VSHFSNAVRTYAETAPDITRVLVSSQCVLKEFSLLYTVIYGQEGSSKAYRSSESELLYDLRFTASQFVLATSPLRLTTSNFIFQLNTCGYSPYVTPSLTRGGVVSFTIASGPRQRSHSQVVITFYCLRFETPPPNLEGQVPVFISPRNRVAWL